MISRYGPPELRLSLDLPVQICYWLQLVLSLKWTADA